MKEPLEGLEAHHQSCSPHTFLTINIEGTVGPKPPCLCSSRCLVLICAGQDTFFPPHTESCILTLAHQVFDTCAMNSLALFSRLRHQSNQLILNAKKAIPCKARNLVKDCNANSHFRKYSSRQFTLWALFGFEGVSVWRDTVNALTQQHKSMQMLLLLYQILGNGLTHEEYFSTSAWSFDSITFKIQN